MTSQMKVINGVRYREEDIPAAAKDVTVDEKKAAPKAKVVSNKAATPESK